MSCGPLGALFDQWKRFMIFVDGKKKKKKIAESWKGKKTVILSLWDSNKTLEKILLPPILQWTWKKKMVDGAENSAAEVG